MQQRAAANSATVTPTLSGRATTDTHSRSFLAKAAETTRWRRPDGLANYLVAQAKQNPGPFLLGKVLPTQVLGRGGRQHLNLVRVPPFVERLIDRSGVNVWTTSLCWARHICARF
jgi:hypothetical protein